MEIMEIIEDAFKFPSKDWAKLAIYIVLAVISGILIAIGVVMLALGLMESVAVAVIGAIILILALLVIFIVSGYQISIIKAGIEHAESAPEFDWKGNLITGVKYIILNIVYFIIPAIIVLIVAWATNIFGMVYEMGNLMYTASANAPANTTVEFTNVIPQSLMINFGTAVAIVALIAFVLFIIFAIIQTMGQSRLAKTDSLGNALNIPEAFKDIGRIGWGKVLAVVILVFVIIFVINAVIAGLNNYIAGISILSLIVTPYLTFFAARATGLLYSDIE